MPSKINIHREDLRDQETPTFGPLVEPPAGVFRCPFCKSTAGTYDKHSTSGAGWIVVLLMLLICFPLFFIGLGIKEKSTYCLNCHTKIA